MSIIDSITNNLVQDVVYWAVTGDNGYGEYTYAAGVDIKGRWEEVAEKVMSMKGEEAVSRIRCFVDVDVIEGGYLFLGTTSDSAYAADPKTVEGAQQIIAFSKIPRLGKTNQFARKAHCNMSGNATI